MKRTSSRSGSTGFQETARYKVGSGGPAFAVAAPRLLLAQQVKSSQCHVMEAGHWTVDLCRSRFTRKPTTSQEIGRIMTQKSVGEQIDYDINNYYAEFLYMEAFLHRAAAHFHEEKKKKKITWPCKWASVNRPALHNPAGLSQVNRQIVRTIT